MTRDGSGEFVEFVDEREDAGKGPGNIGGAQVSALARRLVRSEVARGKTLPQGAAYLMER